MEARTLISSYLPCSLFIQNQPKFSSSNLKIRASISAQYPLASKIIVKNLPFTTNERCLQDKFSKFGQIDEVKLIKDEATKKSKGYAFIQYTSQEEALLALESMDHQYVDGRLVFVDIAKLQKNEFSVPKTSGPPTPSQLQNLASEGNSVEE